MEEEQEEEEEEEEVSYQRGPIGGGGVRLRAGAGLRRLCAC